MFARWAIRKSVVMALRGRTMVGQNVSDSRIGAIDIAADGVMRVDGDKPFIDVYTDDSKIDPDSFRGPLDLHRNGTQNILIEAAIASPMIITDPETGESVVDYGQAALPATDDKFDLWLDIMDRQVVNALTDAENEWAELVRRMCDGLEVVARGRRAREEDGTRRAARQTLISVRLLPDPIAGAPLEPGNVWDAFRALVERDVPAELPIVDMMMGSSADLTLAHIQAMTGRSSIAMANLGLAYRDSENPDLVWEGHEAEKVIEDDPA